jgi:NAD-dependent SIR2 family protein deacetylase
VYPAADFALDVVRRGAPLVIVNLGDTDHDHRATVKVEGSAGVVLPTLATILTRTDG